MAALFKKKKETEVDPSEPHVTDKLPVVPFKVLEVDIPFYRDQGCKDRVEDATLAILQALDPEDDIQELDIVPTTKRYEKGSYVTMNLDNKKLWEDCFFLDPETGQVRKAWQIHVNFIGSLIAPEVVEKEKQHLEDLERKVQEKIEEIAQRHAQLEEESVN